ncbi:MAG TPA: PHB depolymerase family esterase [Planctomycetota bacterium]|jgi:polyhydroxybutyrate depolymerase|nr:PHB depolymerase family esterase [Planctomycetota bacterium]
MLDASLRPGLLLLVILLTTLSPACARRAVASGSSGAVGGDENGTSPGPGGLLPRRDYRVSLKWIASPVTQEAGQMPARGPGDYGRKLALGGKERYYEVHAPAGYEPGKPTPLVLVLHGGGGFATLMRHITGLDEVADREGFLVLYAAGTHTDHSDRLLFWNTGHPTKDPRQAKVDDVAYFRAVLDDVSKFFSVDPRRVHATGISNGGQMCYRLATELSDRIASIAPVAGQATADEFSGKPARAVPVMHFHGLKDEFAPYAGGVLGGGSKRGGKSVFEPYPFKPVPEVIRSWAAHNGCAEEPAELRVGKGVRQEYSGGQGGADVVLWTLEDGGHTWPGGESTRAERRSGAGDVSKAVKASKAMWRFFSTHPMRP